jgi:DNA-directed RNA polymerase subunit RPC12/RpoP
MKQCWKWNRKKGWVPRNTPYNNHYYCSKCRRWIPKAEAEKSPKRMLRCPSCGKKLRTKARIYGKRKLKPSTPAMNATPFQTLHSASGFPPRPAESLVAESIIKPAKQGTAQKPCNNNIESMRNMGVWKK